MERVPAPHVDLPLASLFFYGPIYIFGTTFLIMLVAFVIPTWRSSDKNRKRFFWNWIELIWLLLALFSVAVNVPHSWGVVTKTLQADYESNREFRSEQLQGSSQSFIQVHCEANQSSTLGEICHHLQEIIKYDDWGDYNSIYQLMERHGDLEQSAAIKIGNIYSILLAAYLEAYRIQLNEQYGLRFIHAIQKAQMFWPHVLAFAFGLRISRALAVFAL